MLKRILILVWLSFLTFFPLVGCIERTDPATGETKKQIDPNHLAIPIAESGAALAVNLLPLAGPVGGAAAATILAALTYWMKVKPELTQERTAAQQGHIAGTALVEALEDYKKQNPQGWEALGELIAAQLDKLGTDATTVENFIRGLRGLAPKG